MIKTPSTGVFFMAKKAKWGDDMAKSKWLQVLERIENGLVEAWARDGLIDEEIAKRLGISRDTFYKYKKEYAVFSEALKKGKEVVDYAVESALLKRALGYEYVEVTKERIVDSGQRKRHGGESELSEQEWVMAIAYFNGRCCYCDECTPELTKDHIKPLIQGGGMTRSNIVPCCRSCNSSKKDHEMESWYRKQPTYRDDRLQKIYDYLTFVDYYWTDEAVSTELVVTKEVTKQQAPDVTAQIFWLKNRKPKSYRDKQDLQLAGNDDGPIKIEPVVQIYLPDNRRD